jgi:hypothetical protein
MLLQWTTPTSWLSEVIHSWAQTGDVSAIDRTYKVHLDGYNSLPYLTGKEEHGPRREVFYF